MPVLSMVGCVLQLRKITKHLTEAAVVYSGLRSEGWFFCLNMPHLVNYV